LAISNGRQLGHSFVMAASAPLITPGRFVILLNGRHAGKKAVVLTASQGPTEGRKYPHAVVLGIEKSPKTLQKSMSQEVLVARTQIKVFVKTVNFNHLLLTRHQLKEDDFWSKVKPEVIVNSLKDPSEKKAVLEVAAGVLRQKYLNNKFPWLFKPLQF
jgi:large subunit ribosomal protein L27e